MTEEDLLEAQPPSAEKVARRALTLAVVSCRAFVEGDKLHPDWAADLARDSRQWLSDIGLDDELTDWERRVLDTPFGQVSDLERIDATWLSEAVTVFAWALGKRPEPEIEEQCDPAVESGLLGFLGPLEETTLHQPTLRSAEELAAYNEFTYAVHWRLRDYQLKQQPYDFRTLARETWGDPVHKFGLELQNDDLAIRGRSISEASESDRRMLTSITRERHRASNWLIGYATPDFYEVPTDT